MKAKLKDAMKEAMKAKDKVRLETIRSVLSEMQYEEMQKGVEELDTDSIMQLISRELKKRREEVEFAEKASRGDLTEKLSLEIATLESFLPKQLNKDELKAEIQKFVSTNSGAQMGAVMKHLKDNFSGSYDGKLASAVVKEVLG